MQFEEFLNELQRREGVKPAQSLVRSWRLSEVELVCSAIGSGKHRFIGKVVRDRRWAKASNQSRGNMIAKLVTDIFADKEWTGVELLSAEKYGKGYPDRILRLPNSDLIILVELKATSDWKPKDTNRRVLTSSSSKMRAIAGSSEKASVPLHLMLTVTYGPKDKSIRSLRLDFLNPEFEVSVRFEASTSHKGLTEGDTSGRVFSDEVST